MAGAENVFRDIQNADFVETIAEAVCPEVFSKNVYILYKIMS